MEKNRLGKSSEESHLFFSVLGDMVKVFSAISNEDSLKIFYAAGDGIESSTKAIRQLGLTQKRYYTRLKELLEAGLLQKKDNVYTYTALGKVCYRLGTLFMETLSHSEQLELIDRVGSSPTLSLTEKEKVIEALSKEGLANYVDLLNGGIKRVGIVTEFEDISAGVKRLIEKAEKEVYLATRYTDTTITETILNSLNRGIEMYLLDGDRKNLSQKIQLIRLVLSHPKMVKLFYQIFRSPNVHTWYTSDLPYSFIVVDRRYVGIEIPKPRSDEFFLGLFFENEVLSRKLIEVFHLLTRTATKDPKEEFAEKMYARFPKEKLNNKLPSQE